MGDTNGRAPDVIAMADRMPPRNIEVESELIGALILESDRIDDVRATGLTPGDLWSDNLAEFLRALYQLHDLGAPITAGTLAEYMEHSGTYQRAGGDETLEKACLSAPHAANAVYHAQITRQLALVRRLIRTCDDISRDCYSRRMSADAILSSAEARISELSSESVIASELVPARDHARRAMEKFRARQGGQTFGVPSGWRDLDALTDGFQPGELILLAARTSVGKSCAALNIAEHAALDRGLGVLYVSMEMLGDALMSRLMAGRSEIDSQRLKMGDTLDADEWRRLSRVCEELEEASRFILDDRPVRTVGQIAANARRLQRSGGLDLLVVDYLQLIDSISELGGRASREERVAYVSKRLLAIAVGLQIPVIALSQLNRESVKGEGGRPRVSQLRESGSLEQDAHTVLLLHRPEMFKPGDRPGYAELIIAKSRSGPTGTVPLRFAGQYLRFEDWNGPIPGEEPDPAERGGDYDDAPGF